MFRQEQGLREAQSMSCKKVRGTHLLRFANIPPFVWQVVGVKSREIVLNAGNIHCITQQFPAAT